MYRPRPRRPRALLSSAVVTAATTLALAGCGGSGGTRANDGVDSSTGTTPAVTLAPPTPVESSPPAPTTSTTTPTPDPSNGGDGTQGTASPSASAASDVFSGTHEVRLALVERAGSYLSVGSKDRATITKGTGISSLFVLTRRGTDVVISTARWDTGGQQTCLTDKDIDSTMPIVLVALPCTQDRHQLFTFTPLGKRHGTTVYAISDDSAGYVQWSSDPKFALYVQEIGDSRLETTFTVEDQGSAQALD